MVRVGGCGHYDRYCTCGAEERVSVQLVGEDGNVFSVIGRVSRALVDVGHDDLAADFRKRAFASRSYDEVLWLVSEFVDVE